MKKLKVYSKTGFKIIDKNVPVIINDFRGKEFYNNSLVSNPVAFNLPAGDYEVISGRFAPLTKPLEFPLNKLPFPERSLPFPGDFKIEFGNNPNKASIIWPEKRILFDNSMLTRSLPELYFILFHEFAHHVYNTEVFTDRLAENFMLRHGFNPSQTMSSPVLSLSAKQYDRKKDAINRLENRAKLWVNN